MIMVALAILLLLDLAEAMSVPGPAYVVVGTIYFAVHAVLGVMDGSSGSEKVDGVSPMFASDVMRSEGHVQDGCGRRSLGNADWGVTRHRRGYTGGLASRVRVPSVYGG